MEVFCWKGVLVVLVHVEYNEPALGDHLKGVQRFVHGHPGGGGVARLPQVVPHVPDLGAELGSGSVVVPVHLHLVGRQPVVYRQTGCIRTHGHAIAGSEVFILLLDEAVRHLRLLVPVAVLALEEHEVVQVETLFVGSDKVHTYAVLGVALLVLELERVLSHLGEAGLQILPNEEHVYVFVFLQVILPIFDDTVVEIVELDLVIGVGRFVEVGLDEVLVHGRLQVKLLADANDKIAHFIH